MLLGAAADRSLAPHHDSHERPQGPHSKEAGQGQGKGKTASCGLGRSVAVDGV